MIEKVKNNKFLVVSSILFEALLIFIIRFSGGTSMDLFQLFTNAHMMKLGSVLYKDINLITTPLVHYINYLAVLIWDQTAVLLILNAIYLTALTYVNFRINLELGAGRKSSFIISAGISLIHAYCEIWCYNSLCVLLGAISLMLLLKISKKDKISVIDIIVLGALSGASIMSKQSIGLAFAAGTILCLLLMIHKKGSFKSILSAIVLFGISFACSIMLIMIPVIVTDAFPDFLDQVVFGLSSFKLDFLIDTLIKVLSYITFFVVMFAISQKSLQGVIVYIMGICSLSCMFPTANIAHMSCSWCFIMFTISYYISHSDEDIKKPASIIENVASIIAGGIAVFIIVVQICSNYYGFSNLKYTKGMYQVTGFEEIINEVNEYIDEHPEKEYRIISTYATYFNVNRSDTFYKYYDMILEGNTGTVDALEMIKEDKDKYYFIADCLYEEGGIDWQINKSIFDYLYSDEFVVEEVIGDTGFAVYRLDADNSGNAE